MGDEPIRGGPSVGGPPRPESPRDEPDQGREIDWYRSDDLILGFCGPVGAYGVYRCWLGGRRRWEFCPAGTEAWERDDCPGTLPMPLQYMACAEAQSRIGLAARKEGAKARELVGMPVGQVVGRMSQELSSSEVIYQFIEEFIDAVERLQGMLDAAK